MICEQQPQSRIKDWAGADGYVVIRGQRIGITRTPCHLGGFRAWFLCPSCDRRCGVLYLQKMSGYSVTGLMEAELVHYHFGPGGNGKTVFTGTRQKLLGEYMTPATETAFTMNAAGHRNHLSELAVLRGARCVTISEPEKGLSWNMGRVKQLSGRERFRVNYMRHDPFWWQPTCKLEMVANHQLKINEMDDGVKRRMRMIGWLNKPKTIDPKLADKMVEKKGPQILRWIIDGAQMYLKEGLTEVPDAIEAITKTYLEDQDDVGRFISDCLTPTGDMTDLKVSRLAKICKRWAQDAGVEIKTGKLGQLLKDAGMKVLRNDGPQHLRGYRLTSYSDELEIQIKEAEDREAKPEGVEKS